MPVLDEGDGCPACAMYGDTGTLHYARVDDCFCHISPPCSNCVESPLQCDLCGYRPHEDGDIE